MDKTLATLDAKIMERLQELAEEKAEMAFKAAEVGGLANSFTQAAHECTVAHVELVALAQEMDLDTDGMECIAREAYQRKIKSLREKVVS